VGPVIRALVDAPGAVLLVALLYVVGIGAVAVRVSTLDAWYFGLRFPGWHPPDWLFGPAWTTIFLSPAACFVVGWTAPGVTPELKQWMVGAWLVNAVLNVLWSVLFFRLHRPDWALFENALLWLSIVGMMVAVGRQSPYAPLLLVPYLAWVSFAVALNRAIVVRNGPFGA